MIAIELALSVLLALQQEGWQETTFHRIYLRNGNFIDGKVISDKPNEVILLMKAGEMAIRRDQVDKIELMKMKSYNEKPIILAAPKSTTPDATKPNKNTPAPTVAAPEEIRRRVETMIFKLKSSTEQEKEFPIAELESMGEEAVVYLASKAPTLELKMLDALSAALIVLKPTAKVIEVLEALTTNEKPTVRVMAATVLAVGGGDSGKQKYIRPLLQDQDQKVRESALALLGQVEDLEWFDMMCEMSADPNKEVRARAMRNAKAIAVKQSIQDRFIRAMANHLSHADMGVRADAASVIGGLGLKEAWTHLVPALSDSEASVRAMAAQALMTLAVPESGETIILAMRREQDPWTRIYLAGAVQRLKLLPAIEALIPWLSAPEDNVRKAAEGTLRTVTGENFGTDAAKWQEWNSNRLK